MKALEIRNLKKVYANEVVALKGIDLVVESGDFFALLGPNGAGKSTTIGIISSLVNKNHGSISICGIDIDENFPLAKSKLGVVNQEFNFSQFEKVRDVIMAQAGYYGVDPKTAAARTEEYLKKLGIWDKRDVFIRELSGGQKRRVMIIKALIHKPELLILDEPTAGVSPIVMNDLFDRIIDVARTGIAILMVEQNAKQALTIADRGYVLVQGENRYTDTGAALLENPDVRGAFLGG